jgi:tRNA(Ile)-lysidine synthase TilS/MesJ
MILTGTTHHDVIDTRQCKKCLMGTDIASVIIDEDGLCQYCKMHDRLEKMEPISVEREQSLAKTIRNSRKSGKYDCILGISGGSDSSFLMYWCKKMKLNPLTVHFDNGWNTEEAKNNMSVMTNALNMDLQTVNAPKEYDDLNRAFLLAGTSEADLPNDILLLLALNNVAKEHKVKYIINGHNFRTEGTAPLAWTLMDSQYMKDVYEKFVGKKLNIQLWGLWEQLKFRMTGIKSVRPLYNIGSSKKENKEILKEFGWKDYGSIHTENIYTAFVGSYLLPKKFGIDKRRIYLSANIRSGAITKEDANKELTKEVFYSEQYLGEIQERYFNGILEGKTIADIMNTPPKKAIDYGNYYNKYIRYRKVYEFGIKIGMFPKTFDKYINEAPLLVKKK